MGRSPLVRTHKKCCACGEEKPISSDFYITRNKNRSTVSSMCRVCHRAKHRKKYKEEGAEARAKRQETVRASHLRRHYGLTLEDFSAMILEQENQCKICRCQLDDPQVDHNHSTGKVRALLCRPCNMSLGLLKEDPQIIRNMLNYINDYLPED